MRHNIAGNRLGRNQSLRKATIRDLAKATIVEQRIQTTKARAKEARKLVDRLITLGKRDTLSAKRKAFSILSDHKIVSDLFKQIAPRFRNRQGGYSRIIPLGFRRGDNASLVYLELTEKVIEEAPKSTPVKDKGSKPVSPKKEPSDAVVTQDAVEPKKSEVQKSKKVPPSVRPNVIKGKEEGKPSKPMMGGIKKIFNKKTPGQ